MDIDRIIERLRDGEPIRVLADEEGMTWRELRDEVEAKLGSPAEDREDIRERVRNGATLESVAREYATSRQNISRLVTDVSRRYDNTRGERSPRAALTDTQVLAIRNEYADGATQLSLADKYNVSPGTIGRVLRGASWRHVAAVDRERPVQPYLTEAGMDQIARMRDEQMSWEEIADEFGIYRTTLRRAVSQLRPELLEQRMSRNTRL